MEKENRKEVVAARIRAAREAAGLSQGQVAKKLEMHRPTISEIEAGRRNVTLDEIKVFANLYGVESWWLSGTDPEENPNAEMARYELAARELSKMNPDDFDNLMRMLSTLKKSGGGDEQG